MTAASEFKPGDFVCTIEDERDTDVIPAGTGVVLTRPNGGSHWWACCFINGVRRTVLLSTANVTR